MIDIYTNKSDSKNWIFQNDLYFNLNTGNEEMTQSEIDLINDTLSRDSELGRILKEINDTKDFVKLNPKLYCQPKKKFLLFITSKSAPPLPESMASTFLYSNSL